MPSEVTVQLRDVNMIGPQSSPFMNKIQTKMGKGKMKTGGSYPETGTDGAKKKEPEKKTGELKTSYQPRTRTGERKTEMAEKEAGRREERRGIGAESRQSSVRGRAGKVPRSSPLVTCLTIHG